MEVLGALLCIRIAILSSSSLVFVQEFTASSSRGQAEIQLNSCWDHGPTAACVDAFCAAFAACRSEGHDSSSGTNNGLHPCCSSIPVFRPACSSADTGLTHSRFGSGNYSHTPAFRRAVPKPQQDLLHLRRLHCSCQIFPDFRKPRVPQGTAEGDRRLQCSCATRNRW